MNRFQRTTAAPPRRPLLVTLVLVLTVHVVGLFGSDERPYDHKHMEPPEEKTLRWLTTDLQVNSAPATAQPQNPRASKAITEGVPIAQAPNQDADSLSEAPLDEPPLNGTNAPADSAASPSTDASAQEAPAPGAPVEALPTPTAQPSAPAALAQAPSGAPDEAGDALALHQMDGQIPAPALLQFSLKGERGPGVYHARGELSWQHNSAQYRAVYTAKLWFAGQRTQVSRGQIGPLGLSPQKFTDLWRKNERAVHFDNSQQRLVFSATQNKPLLWPGAQDLLSATVQMSAKLASATGQAMPVGQRVWVQTANLREASVWVVERAPNTVLETPNGAVQSSHWVKPATHPRDPRLEAWYALPSDTSPAAISHAWPLRVRISQSNGDYFEQWLEKTTPLPALSQHDAEGKNE
jgi:hypothetical protein